MLIDLTEKVCVVTGGSEGIGAAIAKSAACCGAKVAVLSRDEDEMQEVVNDIKSDGGDAMWVTCDVTSSTETQAALQHVVDRWGGLDLVVANAGTNGKWAPIEELTPDDWNKTIGVNLTGTFLTIHHAVPHLKHRGRGSIVILSSVNGTRVFSNEGASAYAVSKAGQFAFGQMLALELAPFSVRVNVICPGAIDTGIHAKTTREDLDEIDIPVDFPEGRIPLTDGRMPDPSSVANLAVFLLSDLASHITGAPVWIDGAESLLQG